MSVSATSLDANQVIAKRKGNWEKTVLDHIRKYGPVSDREIAAKIDRERGFVSARRNSLVDKGLVFEVGWEFDPKTNIKVSLWAVSK